MDLSGLRLTTAQIWGVTWVVAGIDLLLILGIRRIFPAGRFRIWPRWIALVSFIFFAALWSFVLRWGWDWFYALIFPAWVRSSGLAWGLLYGMVGLGMGWLGGRLPGHPAVNFCLLGGMEGLITHLWAIYGLGAVSKPALMQGVDPFAVLVFAVFEKTFYWILILLLSHGLARLAQRWKQTSLDR